MCNLHSAGNLSYLQIFQTVKQLYLCSADARVIYIPLFKFDICRHISWPFKWISQTSSDIWFQKNTALRLC